MDRLAAARIRRSISDKLVNEARRSKSAVDPVRKQYMFTIFLSRVFQDDLAPWVLLGGNALLIRTGGGRFTQDIDLAREDVWDSPQAALEELRALASRPYRSDPFDFELPSITVHREPDTYGYGAETAKVKARGLLGGQLFEAFTIDITTRRHVDGPVDQVPLRGIISHDTQRDLPSVPTTPIENHLADKICALYEKHGPNLGPSTRYRDLADVVRIVTSLSFDARKLAPVLDREARRRRLELPGKLVTPGEPWETEFPRAAADFAGYPREYWRLADALRCAGSCLNQVLEGSRVDGSWDPRRGAWSC